MRWNVPPIPSLPPGCWMCGNPIPDGAPTAEHRVDSVRVEPIHAECRARWQDRPTGELWSEEP